MISEATLDPPGTIAVVGAGPLGIEAALYGRFLGYDIALIEAESIGHSLRSVADKPLTMLPDRCLSPLAVSAIDAQQPEATPQTLPTTVGEWIEKALEPLVESDLLSGRLRCPFRVTRIELADVEVEDAEDGNEEIPADFRLHSSTGDSLDAEAVILAVGADSSIQFDFELPAEYLFVVGDQQSGNDEQDFLLGLKKIVGIFAQLGGRADLDLYRRNPLPGVGGPT